MSNAPPLVARLVDDAALFPPGNAPMPRALQDHRRYADEWFAGLVGPFLCPASRLSELIDTLPGDEPLAFGLVVDTGTGGVADAVERCRRDGRLDLRALELPLRAETDLGGVARRAAAALLDVGAPEEIAAYVEVPRAPSAPDALDVLAEYDLRAKLRTGGADSSAVPTERELAEFLISCLDRELTFKLTAGLHHAIRHTDATTGHEQHGFLNVLVAVALALDGSDPSLVTEVLAERRAEEIAARAGLITDDRARAVRRFFASYGSCSIAEPVDDLVALGLLAAHTGATS
jgi:hypothetical protein